MLYFLFIARGGKLGPVGQSYSSLQHMLAYKIILGIAMPIQQSWVVITETMWYPSLNYLLFGSLPKVWWPLVYSAILHYGYFTTYLTILVGEHLNCFQFGVIINKIVTNVLKTAIGVHVFLSLGCIWRSWTDALCVSWLHFHEY